MNRQLSFPGMPNIYEYLGIDPQTYRDKTDIKKGIPRQSEDILIAYFPKLSGGGILTPKGMNLKLQRRNIPPNEYDIDYHILANGKAIAFIDNESRSSDYLLRYPEAAIHIPLHSAKYNYENIGDPWDRPMSIKSQYYKSYPDRSFHLAMMPKLDSAFCCHARDFINTEPELVFDSRVNYQGEWRTFDMLVWNCPREKACYGKEHDHTIEDWVLSKLVMEGIL